MSLFKYLRTGHAQALEKKDVITKYTFFSSCKSSQGLSPSSFPALRRPLVEDLDEDIFPIDGDSEILNEKDFGKLSRELPKRLVSLNYSKTCEVIQRPPLEPQNSGRCGQVFVVHRSFW